ncbi:TolB family protein [Streptomyces sp. QH1-20]|uniref:TolB family protein n=1 Tax=Streptomyces sp. QH1-20 TaxID=3240934 RepID=UPI003516A305
MRRLRRTAVLAAILGTCATALPVAQAAAAGEGRRATGAERVSVTAAGEQADGESYGPVISGDGRFVAFVSWAANLAPGGKAESQVYVKNRSTGRLQQVSVTTDGTRADGASGAPSISATGRYVAFESFARNLAPGGNPDPGSDVYVRDLWTGRTELVTGDKPSTRGSSSAPAISADGRYVAFASTRDDLVPGDTNLRSDVFVRDRWKGTTKRVSVRNDGTQVRLASVQPVISADGSKVGFRGRGLTDAPEPPFEPPSDSTSEPTATGFRPPSSNEFYVHDQRTGRLELAAHDRDGRPAPVGGFQLSPDGRHALFTSRSATVVEGDSNNRADAFVKDLRTGVTRRVSLAHDGAQADGHTYGDPVMSADGRRVFFVSTATNLVPGDTNEGVADVFVRDLRTGAVERLNVASDGSQDNGGVVTVAADLPGRTAVFESSGDSLVPGDTNKVTDVFLRRVR